VFNRLGDSLANWQQLLTEIKKARSTFDTSDTHKSFGVCVIDYEQVQARVIAKYDLWQRNILSRFGFKLGNGCLDLEGPKRSQAPFNKRFGGRDHPWNLLNAKSDFPRIRLTREVSAFNSRLPPARR
jgi:hypothetical protein